MCKVAWTLACVLLASTDVGRLAVACTRAACLPERSRRARRAGVHARCFGLTSLDVHHVDVALLQTQNHERDDDERDDDERAEPDEREEVPDERVRVRFKNCETVPLPQVHERVE